MTLLRNQPRTERDEFIDRINRGEILVMPLRSLNQIDPERVACFTMSSITLDGHDYHVHEDSQERSFSVVDAHDLHKLGEAHISPCGEYWLVQLDDDSAAPFGSGWSIHTDSTTQEEVARSIVSAAAH